MNANPGGAQRHLQDTVIPLNNPPPKPGHPDTCGQPQSMTYPSDYPNPALQGKAKGLKAVLNEHESVWDEMIVKNGGKRPVEKCKECKKSQAKKDVERKVAEAEAMGRWSRAFGPPLVPGVPRGPFPVYRCLLVVCRSHLSCHPLPFGAFASCYLRSLSIRACSTW